MGSVCGPLPLELPACKLALCTAVVHFARLHHTLVLMCSRRPCGVDGVCIAATRVLYGFSPLCPLALVVCEDGVEFTEVIQMIQQCSELRTYMEVSIT